MKTTEEIYNEIIAEKESGNYPELEELNSTSKVSVWRLWVWIFSFASRTVLQLFEDLKEWMQDYFERKQVGTLRWWIDTVKAFQYGDSLQYINGVWKYAVENTSKQIVKQVALELKQKILLFKVAKIENEKLAPLAEEEQAALKHYVNQVKLAGQFIDLVSISADRVKFQLRVYYNAQYSQSIVQQKIEEAINDYLSNIVFNGELIITQLIDQLQKIEGVYNPVYVAGYYSNVNYVDWQLLSDNYKALSGYFELENVEIEFVPYVQN